MKFLLGLLLLSTVSLAVPVEGKMTYKLPNGELVDRDVTLDVPMRGEGEVVLSGGDFKWTSKSFGTRDLLGAKYFWVVFKNEFMNKKSTVVLKGAYLKGSNRLIYSGDFFKAKGHPMFISIQHLKRFKYIGNFRFEFDRD